MAVCYCVQSTVLATVTGLQQAGVVAKSSFASIATGNKTRVDQRSPSSSTTCSKYGHGFESSGGDQLSQARPVNVQAFGDGGRGRVLGRPPSENPTGYGGD